MYDSEYKETMMNLFAVPADKNKQVFLGDIEFGCLRYNIGKAKMREVAQQAGAVVYIGKLWRFVVPKTDKFLCDKSE